MKNYKINSNYIKIKGTDEFKELFVSLLAIPYKGVHLGVRLSVNKVYEEIKEKLNPLVPVFIEGHSLGGARGQWLAVRLINDGFQVILETQGAFGIFVKRFSIPKTLRGRSRRYGRDPVVKLFPWFKQPFPIKQEGKKKGYFSFMENFKDHMRYWGGK